MEKTKHPEPANGQTNISPEDVMRADAQASVDHQAMMTDFHATRSKYAASGALQVLVLPGADLRLLTYGLSKNQLIHMLSSIIQSVSTMPDEQVASLAAANESSAVPVSDAKPGDNEVPVTPIGSSLPE